MPFINFKKLKGVFKRYPKDRSERKDSPPAIGASPTTGPVPAPAAALTLTLAARSKPSLTLITAVPVPLQPVDFASPTGKQILGALRSHLCLRPSEPAGRVYRFIMANGEGLADNLIRIQPNECVTRRPKKARRSTARKVSATSRKAPLGPASFHYVKYDPAALLVNTAVLSLFRRILWGSYIDTVHDVPRRSTVLKNNSTDDEWVSAERIRTFRAVPKFRNPLAMLPKHLIKHKPDHRSPLRTVTVVVEKTDVNEPLESTGPFHFLVDMGAARRQAGTTVARPAAAARNRVSYRSGRGAALLSELQGYLGLEGETAYKTSGWICENWRSMREVRFGRKTVELPEDISMEVERGEITEEEAQREVRGRLRAALDGLDWDEIDEEMEL